MVHPTEVMLGGGVPQFSRLAEPDDGLPVILRHALALGVHAAEGRLRFGEALLCQRTKQPHRGRVVPALICSYPV